MFEYLNIELVKTSKILSALKFSSWEAFCFRLTGKLPKNLNRRDRDILTRHRRSNFGEVYTDLWHGDKVPKIPDHYINKVEYQKAGFREKYPNGCGHYGETYLESYTCDGKQSLRVYGKSVSGVHNALKQFIKGKLPTDWEEDCAYTTARPQVIIQKQRSQREEDELFDLETSWLGT